MSYILTVKKEDVFCHIGGFIAVLVLYFASVLFSGNSQVEIKPSILSDIEKSLNKDDLDTFVKPQLPVKQNIQITNSIVGSSGSNNTNETPDCSLHIADSSVPNSGFGIFAMKSVKVGSELIPGGAPMHIGGVDLSPYIMLIKHHPSFHNVNGGIGGSAIVATKDIEEGEEIFFNLDEYPNAFQTVYRKANPSHPTATLFNKVNDITKKIIDAIPTKLITVKPKRKQYKQKTKPKTFKRPSIDATPLIQLLKETLHEYDPALADLFPDSHVEAMSMIEAGGRVEYISNKRSSLWLSKGGVCVNGVKPPHEGKYGAVTTRKVKKGDIVISSPVYATSINEGNESCFLVNEEGLMLCPFSFSSKISQGLPSSQCDTETSKKCPHNLANAFYQWSEVNEFNKSIQHMSISELLEVS